jgi:hypothetical protein
MTPAPRIVALAVALGLAAAGPAEEAAPPPAAPPADAKALEATLYRTLRDVINRGVDLYRRDDHAACYRLYEGSLMTLKPLLGHRQELQKEIDKRLEGARRDPLMWRRAFTLRSALDKVREELNPDRDKLHKPKAEEGQKEKKEEKDDNKDQ